MTAGDAPTPPVPVSAPLGRLVLAGVLWGLGSAVLRTYFAPGTLERYAAAGVWGALVFGAVFRSLSPHAFRRSGSRGRAVGLGSLAIGTLMAVVSWLLDRAFPAA